MIRASVVAAAMLLSPLFAQQTCPPTPTYSRCEIVFELNDAEAKTHPKPYETVELHAEFRSPHHDTYVMPAFWDGGRRLVIRFTPMLAGDWQFRVTSNVQRWTDKEYTFNAPESTSDGFIVPANVHHWMYTEKLKPHLWLGDTLMNVVGTPVDEFHKFVDDRAAAKFTHIRGAISGDPETAPDYFRELDQRIAYINSKGLVFDAVLSLKGRDQRPQLFANYMIGRYSPFNITWEMAENFEDVPNGKALAAGFGQMLKRLDPYKHPRSAGAHVTSSPLVGDGWATHVDYGTTDEQIGAIEHQLYSLPFVNEGVKGKSAADFMHSLWNASMNGQYVTAVATTPEQMQIVKQWQTFFDDTRHWELEPFYDADGGRAVALEGVEYVMYIEQPGPVEVRVEKHGYDVAWFNPATGEFVREKNWKGERFAAEPPSKDHPWVLYLSREGKKESMANSYKFESRRILFQEVETSVQKMAVAVEAPPGNDISMSHPAKYQAKLLKQTRGTRWMYYVWSGEVVTSGLGARVLGVGQEGTLKIPPAFAEKMPAILNLRLNAMNANGKVYAIDKIYTLSQ